MKQVETLNVAPLHGMGVERGTVEEITPLCFLVLSVAESHDLDPRFWVGEGAANASSEMTSCAGVGIIIVDIF